jgi:hypothetical protein
MYMVGGLMVNSAGIRAVQAVFLLLLVFVAMFAGLARRLKVPYPILLVIAGLLLSFLPGMPRIGLDPDLVFLVFLPPLLYSAAWTLSWRFIVAWFRLEGCGPAGRCGGGNGCDCRDINCAKGRVAAAHRGRSGSGEPGERWNRVAGAAVWVAEAGDLPHTIFVGRGWAAGVLEVCMFAVHVSSWR